MQTIEMGIALDDVKEPDTAVGVALEYARGYKDAMSKRKDYTHDDINKFLSTNTARGCYAQGFREGLVA